MWSESDIAFDSLFPTLALTGHGDIIICLYMLDNQRHNLPDIHAKHAEFEASIGPDDCTIVSGDLPRKERASELGHYISAMKNEDL